MAKGKSYTKTYRKYARYANTAVKALKVANQVRQLVNTEFHFYEAKLGTTGIDYDGVLYDLCVPAQGLKDSERQGDSIYMKHLIMNGHISYNPLGNATQTITLMIYLDKADKYSSPDDILDDSEVGSQWAPYAAKDRDNTFNTKTLWKRTYILSAQKDFAKVRASIKAINMHAQFEEGTTQPNTNRLRMLCISDTGLNLPKLTFLSRVSFIDN